MPKRDHAVYVISVAAELAGVHPQTLRVYERKGLVSPERTSGNTRRYSVADIERLNRIQELTQAVGVNLAGVKMILDLEHQLDRMRRRLERMVGRLDELEQDTADEVRDIVREAGALVPVSQQKSLKRLLKELEARQRLEGERAEGRRPIPMGPGGATTR